MKKGSARKADDVDFGETQRVRKAQRSARHDLSWRATNWPTPSSGGGVPFMPQNRPVPDRTIPATSSPTGEDISAANTLNRMLLRATRTERPPWPRPKAVLFLESRGLDQFRGLSGYSKTFPS